MTEKIEDFRSGYVAVIGRPNVGKSTLINALVGEKVSITSKKPQTTRDRIMGVLTTEDAQYIFVDTPGFQTKHSSELLDRMNKSVKSSLSDVDAVVMVIESTGWRPEDEEVLKLLPHDAKNVILAINKTDEVKESEVILPLIQESMKKFAFADVVPVSAEKNHQLDVLLQVIRKSSRKAISSSKTISIPISPHASWRLKLFVKRLSVCSAMNFLTVLPS